MELLLPDWALTLKTAIQRRANHLHQLSPYPTLQHIIQHFNQIHCFNERSNGKNKLFIIFQKHVFAFNKSQVFLSVLQGFARVLFLRAYGGIHFSFYPVSVLLSQGDVSPLKEIAFFVVPSQLKPARVLLRVTLFSESWGGNRNTLGAAISASIMNEDLR